MVPPAPAEQPFTLAALAARARDIRAPFIVPLALLVLARVLFMLAQPFASEDAYIAFRYARHLVDGLGLTYNAGEKVMGFTSLPWTLWCALGLVLHVSPVLWTQVSSTLADAASLILMTDLLSRCRGRGAGWAFAMFFSTWPLFAASAVSGLESSAFFLLMVTSALLIERRSRWAGVPLGVLAVLRPEGLLAGAVMACWADRRARIVSGTIALGTIGGLWAYYGSPIPQSVIAKSALYGTPGPWAGRHWWDWLFPAPLGRYPASTEGLQLVPIAILFAASVVQGARDLWARRWPAIALVTASGLGIWLAYSALGVAYFWWYMVVPVATLGVLASVGLPGIVKGALVPAMATVFVLGTWTLALPLYLGRARAEYVNNMSVANVLRTSASPSDTVMVEPIGMIGFETHLHVVDEVGLVSTAVVRRRLAGAGWYADIANATKPRWLVLRQEVLSDASGYAGAGAPFRSAAEQHKLLSHYRLVWPDRPLDGIVLRVFQRDY